MGTDVLNTNTDLSYSGFIQKTSSAIGQQRGGLFGQQQMGGGLFGQQNTPTQIINSLPEGVSTFDVFKINNDLQVFNDALDFFLEGQREKREGVDKIGKISWVSANIPSQALKKIYIESYLKGYEKGDLVPTDDDNILNNIKSYYNEGKREQKEGINPIGKINFIASNDSSDIDNANLYALYYLLGRRDESAGMNRILSNSVVQPVVDISQPPIIVEETTSIPRPIKLAPMPMEFLNDEPIKPKPPVFKPNVSDEDIMSEDMGDEELRTGDETDGKILGMPKGVAIGLGIGVVVIAGLLIFKRK
jgi:hypothetical protein